MDYSSLDDVPHSVRMTLQQQHQQRQILSPAFSIVTDSSPQQTHIYICIDTAMLIEAMSQLDKKRASHFWQNGKSCTGIV